MRAVKVRSSLIESLENRQLLSASGFKLHPVMPIGSGSVSTQLVPNDGSYGSLWGMGKINAPAAWDTSTGSTTVTVANIDTGIDYAHADLYKNVWVNQAEIPASSKANLSDLDGDGLITLWDLNDPINQGAGKISDTNADARIDARDLLAPAASGGWADGINGVSYLGYTYNGINYGADPYVDDIVGWNFYNNTNNPYDGGTANGTHGTHTAGTIAAIGNNGIGVAGVNWKSQVMSLKIFGDDGNGANDTAIGNSIRYAFNNGAGMANASWGGGGGLNNMTDPLYASIKEGGDRKGFLFVAAAGNGDIFGRGYNNDAAATTFTYPVFPATYTLPNIIAVAATDSNDALASFSNWGATSVDLGAPGVNVLSTIGGSTYASYNGTSMATPHVTGVAALLKSINSGANYSSLKTAILSGVDSASALVGKTTTGGRLNALKAIQSLPVAIPPAITTFNASATSSSQINLSWNNVAGESGYRLERSTSSSFTTVTGFDLAANVTSYSDTGLAASTIYYYRVQSVGTAGGSSFISAQAQTLAVSAVAPLAPALTSAQATPTSVKLNWSNVANETGYKVEKLVGTTWTQIGTTGADVLTLTDTAVSSNKTYSYRVRAFNAAGNSPYSVAKTVKTPKRGTTTTTFGLAGVFSGKPIASSFANIDRVVTSLDQFDK